MSALKRIFSVSVVSAALILVGAGCSSTTTIDTNGSLPPVEASADIVK